jgi:hypothetical protein
MANLVQKVRVLERDISDIKKYLGFGLSKKDVAIDVDFDNWQKIKGVARKIRKELFKEKYPGLYAKLKKRR